MVLQEFFLIDFGILKTMHVATQVTLGGGGIIIVIFLLVMVLNPNFLELTIKPGELTIKNSPEVYVPESSTGIPNFVDPKKGSQFYLDKYYNDPDYKEWFDINFPDYTIQEAVGLAFPDDAHSIEKKIPPIAKILGPSTSKHKTEINLSAESSSDPDGGKIIRFLWILDDGSTYSDQSITHVYLNAGSHVIDLIVTDDEDQTGQARHFINILP